MPSVPQVSTNSFDNSASFLGGLALAINSSRVVTGIFNGEDPVAVGSRVKIDSTVTTSGVIKFVPADDNEAAFGCIVQSPQEGETNPGDTIEVAFSGGQCMTQVGGATLTPGTPVAMSAGFLAAVDGTHLQMGLLLDYVTVSTPGRVLLGWVPC